MKMIVGLLLIALTSVGYADVNFDNGTGKGIREDMIKVPVPDVKYGVPGSVRYTRDCARFNFGPQDGEIMSEKVWLRSDEYRTECYTTYVPGPNGQQIPQQHCYEHYVMTYHRQVQINIKPRKLYPWEREVFEVCLEGRWLGLHPIEAAYKYKVRQVGYYDTLFELYPDRKIPTRPDPDGLNYVEFSYNKETKKYTFRVADKWAKEYAGEKVYIKIELKKDVANWFDSLIGSKEYIFDVAGEYTMEFSEDELVKPKDNSEENTDRVNERLFETKGYYLRWGFKRIGEISKDIYVDKGKTNRVQQ